MMEFVIITKSMGNAMQDRTKNEIRNLSVSDQNSFSFFAMIYHRLLEFYTSIIATNLMVTTIIDS